MTTRMTSRCTRMTCRECVGKQHYLAMISIRGRIISYSGANEPECDKQENVCERFCFWLPETSARRNESLLPRQKLPAAHTRIQTYVMHAGLNRLCCNAAMTRANGAEFTLEYQSNWRSCMHVLAFYCSVGVIQQSATIPDLRLSDTIVRPSTK